jgi:anti-sigma factor RsiW
VSHPRADLTAFLDGALPPARAEEVRAHLAGCPACREEEARLRGAVALLSSLPPAPELPPFFATRLEARLREERERAAGGPLPRWLAALAGPRPRRRALALAGGLLAALLLAAIPLRSWLDTRAMVRDLDLLEDYETARAVGVDSAEDVLIVAQLDELERAEGRP